MDREDFGLRCFQNESRHRKVFVEDYYPEVKSMPIAAKAIVAAPNQPILYERAAE
jgi:hypothetical protein